MDVIVNLAAALICFTGQCRPVLVGADTPVGEFKIQQRQVLESGYGGDVLQFHEDDQYVWAIHRVWLGDPKEKRLQRLQSGTAADRHITHGCLNVMPKVYEELKACCSNATMSIIPGTSP